VCINDESVVLLLQYLVVGCKTVNVQVLLSKR